MGNESNLLRTPTNGETMNSSDQPTNSQLATLDKVLSILHNPCGDKEEAELLANLATPAYDVAQKLLADKINSLNIRDDDKSELRFWVETISDLSLLAGGIQLNDYVQTKAIFESSLDV